MVTATAPVPTNDWRTLSDHIQRETRRMISDGWLRDGKRCVEIGSRDDGWVRLLLVASRRPNHTAHRVWIDLRTHDARCECEGFRRTGHCAHCLLALSCCAPGVWDGLMFPAPIQARA